MLLVALALPLLDPPGSARADVRSRCSGWWPSTCRSRARSLAPACRRRGRERIAAMTLSAAPRRTGHALLLAAAATLPSQPARLGGPRLAAPRSPRYRHLCLGVPLGLRAHARPMACSPRGPRAGLASDSGRTRPQRRRRRDRAGGLAGAAAGASLRCRPGRRPSCEPARIAGRRAGDVARDDRAGLGLLAPLPPPLDWLAGALGRSLGCQSPTSRGSPSCSPRCPAASCPCHCRRRRGADRIRAPRRSGPGPPRAPSAACWGAGGAPRAPPPRSAFAGSRAGRPRLARCSRAGWAGPAGYADRALPRRRAGRRHASSSTRTAARCCSTPGRRRPAPRGSCAAPSAGLAAVVTAHASRDHHGGLTEVLDRLRRRAARRRRRTRDPTFRLQCSPRPPTEACGSSASRRP